MHEAIPPLSQYVFMAWCLVKYRDNFTFTLYLKYRNVIDSVKQLIMHFFEVCAVSLQNVRKFSFITRLQKRNHMKNEC
jgi:hypothetical protein